MFMRKITAAICLFCSLSAAAQRPAEQKSLVDSIGSARFTMDDSIGRWLAEYVSTNADLKVLDKQIEAGKYEWSTNKFSLLNNISANFNLNELNLKPRDEQTNIFYPRYNFQLTMPIGNFFTKPMQTKKAKAQYEEMKFRKETAARDLKIAVLSAYQDYSLQKYLLGIQDAIIQDEAESFDEVERKFKNNSVTIEQFSAASRRLTETLIQRVNVLRNLNVAKYTIEGLIGMRLEDAIAAIKKKKRIS